MTATRDLAGHTVLVANRGEIASRVFRTARRLGMRSVAVYSDADARLPYVREADQAIRLGPAAPRESYLDLERIVAAAREAGADLVHPGYGFLSEDPRLARALANAGITFVGPPPEALASLGDKAQAKAIAQRAGVPVLPDERGEDQRDEAFIAAAQRIGYPVMVKPIAGGGGIGMQLVSEERVMRDALARARRQAAAAFGDERVLIERAVTRPRHVEVQILADAHGKVIALGERDCSLQRRHQKVLEECPSPAVGPVLRARLETASIAIAREAGYVNAGTVEFLLEERRAFYFIEVNARLQVEHPVTEAVYGVDLVEQQLRIALGERLEISPDARGHAVEARLYAEDPAAGFVPSTGRIVHLQLPDDIRVDAAIERGSEVTLHYDPLLAKLIARGADREEALDALGAALDRTSVLGVRTNLALLRTAVAHPDVRAGAVDTGTLDREIVPGLTEQREPGEDAIALAAAAIVATGSRGERDAWSALGPWRLGTAPGSLVTVGDRAVRVEGSGPFEAAGHRVVALPDAGHFTFDGRSATAVRDGGSMWIELDGAVHEVALEPAERGIEALAGSEITAPMPGTVLSVSVRPGQKVKRGELLLVVEAMKMELRVEAPGAGTVNAVLCAPGQQVRRGQRLVELEADP